MHAAHNRECAESADLLGLEAHILVGQGLERWRRYFLGTADIPHPSEAGVLLRVRVARGDFGVRPVSNGTVAAPSPAAQARKPRRTPSKPAS